MRRVIFPTSLVLAALLPGAAPGDVIEGTRDQIECVHEKRHALSLEGLIDPVPVHAGTCREQFEGDTAVDYTMGNVSPPAPHQSSSQVPPPEDWPQFSIEELDRIPCHLNRWLAENPEAAADAVLSLDLASDCPEAKE